MITITDKRYSIDDFSVDVYLKQIGKAHLLSAEEEQGLGKILQENEEHTDSYKNAFKSLVSSNLRLVVSIAKRYSYLGIPLGDLIGYGNEGLIQAATHYDQSKNVRFATYAGWWIKQSILRKAIDDEPNIRVPVNLYYKNRRIQKFIEDFKKQKFRDPSQDEVLSFERLGNLNYNTVKKGEPLFPMTSLDAARGEDSDSTFKDSIEESKYDTVEVSVQAHHVQETINSALDTLSAREREILKSRFGLDGGYEQTLEEIGLRFNVTRERIRQIEAKALRRLRKKGKNLQSLL